MDGFDIGNVPTVVTIDGDGGGVTISVPKPSKSRDDRKGFHENLALKDGVDLTGVAEELLEGVDIDIKSRTQFIENYTAGMDLLGLEIKDDGQEKTSRIGHPLLLEAVIRAQSAAGGELMPASGPCKVETPGGSTALSDEMSRAFAADMNTYLTHSAPEYYPDTDRGLFGLFYCGNMFKKVYNHPLRRRPVSETVGLDDLIVSEDATDLDTAIRVTHRSEMVTTEVRRMQKFADWRDISLGQADRSFDPARRAHMQIDGVSQAMARPQDIPHDIYEVTCDLDLGDYGLDLSDAPGDLPVSYIVTLDKTSHQVLAIRRGWKQGDEFFSRRQRFVHYGMIPSFRFLCLGFVHLLGNQTKVLRAIWRAMVTSGMYANSPGGMKAKGVRMSKTDVRPGPGEWVDIDLAGRDDIRQALMAMPYKDVSQQFMALAEMIGQDSARMAGITEQLVGEGMTNVPVGTMMSMIEIATQPMSAIHKRLHRAQSRELQLLKDCFIENPEALARIPNIQHQWTRAEEFADITLLPASDPNVPSQIHRIQLATAMISVAQSNPTLYDLPAVHRRAWRTIGVQDSESFVLAQPTPPPPGAAGPAPPDPAIGQARIMEAQAKIAQVKQNATDMQRKAAEAQIEAAAHQRQMELEAQTKATEMAARKEIADTQINIEHTRLQIEQERAQAQHAREIHNTQTTAETARHVAEVKAAADHHAAETAAETAKHTVAAQAKSQLAAARAKPKPKAKKP
jgi:hypothetical protein